MLYIFLFQLHIFWRTREPNLFLACRNFINFISLKNFKIIYYKLFPKWHIYLILRKRYTIIWPSIMFLVHSSRVAGVFVHSKDSLSFLLLRRFFRDTLFFPTRPSFSLSFPISVTLFKNSSKTSSLSSLDSCLQRAFAWNSIKGIGDSGSSKDTIVKKAGLSFRILSSQDL